MPDNPDVSLLDMLGDKDAKAYAENESRSRPEFTNAATGAKCAVRRRPRAAIGEPHNLDAILDDPQWVYEYSDHRGRWCPIVALIPYAWSDEHGEFKPMVYDSSTHGGVFRQLGHGTAAAVAVDPHVHAYDTMKVISRDMERHGSGVVANMEASQADELNRGAIAYRGEVLYPHPPRDAIVSVCIAGVSYGRRNPANNYAWVTDRRPGDNSAHGEECRKQRHNLKLDDDLDGAVAADAEHECMTWVEMHIKKWWNEAEPAAAGASSMFRSMCTNAQHLHIDPARYAREQEHVTIRISRKRLRFLGIVYGTSDRVAGLLELYNRSENITNKSSKHTIGEPPPSNTDRADFVDMYWIVPKPGIHDEGYMNRTAQFGLWHPLKGNWTYYDGHRIVPIIDRDAPINYGTASLEPGNLDGEFSRTDIEPSTDAVYDGTLLEPWLLNQIRAIRYEDTGELRDSFTVNSGWPVAERQLSCKYYTPNLRHVKPLAPIRPSGYSDEEWGIIVDTIKNVPLGTPTAIPDLSATGILNPDGFLNANGQGDDRNALFVWSEVNACYIIPLTAGGFPLRDVRAPFRITEAERDDEMEGALVPAAVAPAVAPAPAPAPAPASAPDTVK
jgi:hypothetical protein